MRDEQDGGDRQQNTDGSYSVNVNRTAPTHRKPPVYLNRNHAHINQTNEKPKSSIGSLATKHYSNRKTPKWLKSLRQFFKKYFTWLMPLLKKIKKLLSPVLKRVWKFIKKLPWKIIAPVVVAVSLVLFAIFHFYIASPDRIVSSIQSNYNSSEILENEVLKATVFIKNIEPFSEDSKDAEDSLYTVSETSKSTNLSLPPKFVSIYAFRDNEASKNQIDTLYDASGRLDISELQKNTVYTSEMLNIANQFFTKDIEEDTAAYVNYVKQSKEQLVEIQSDSSLDTTTLQRIFQQFLDSSEQYQLTKDIENFDRQTNNISSEVYKVIYTTWTDYANSVQTNLSTYRSSMEVLITSYPSD